MENEGFKPLTVELANTDTQKIMSVPFISSESESEDNIVKNALCQGSQIVLTMKYL